MIILYIKMLLYCVDINNETFFWKANKTSRQSLSLLKCGQPIATGPSKLKNPPNDAHVTEYFA
jgi:hypothetical protein